MTKDNTILWVIGMIIAVLVLSFVNLDLFATYPFSEPGLYTLSPNIPTSQFTGSCQPIQSWIDEGWTAGDTSIIKTEKSTFKFITSEIGQYTDSGGSTAIITYSVEIYKDDVLIDTIGKVPNYFVTQADTPCGASVCIGRETQACGPNPTNQIYYRAYSDDGIVYDGNEITPRIFCPATQTYLPEEKTGINVVFGYFNNRGDILHCAGGNPHVIHKINIIGENDTISTDGFSNVNGILVFEDDNLPFDVIEHSTIKITNILQEPEIPEEQLQDYYRLSNNTCSLVTILPSVKTFNDYDTLEECEQATEQEIICLEGFEYNPETNKCEKYPDTGIVCFEGNYNPQTGQCELYPITLPVEEEWYLKEVFPIGEFSFKMWMLLGSIGFLFLLIMTGGRRR